jgi:thioesterase domain-containing protein
MHYDRKPKMPGKAALEALRCAAKLGLRLSREDTTLVFKRRHRIVSKQVSSRFGELGVELAAFVPDLGSSNDCLVPIRPVANPKANLICVHPINGSSFDYHDVAMSMADSYGVYGCDALDGLFSRQPDVSLQSMAGRYFSALVQSNLTRLPIALYGASSGGMIALEMARMMAAAGLPPAIVVLGDTRDLVSSPVHTHYRHKRLIWNAFVEGFFPKEMWDVYPPEHAFWKLDEGERLGYLRDRLKALLSEHEVWAAIDPDLVEDYFITFRRHLDSYGEFDSRPYFGRALFLKASMSPQIASSTIVASLQGDARVQTIEGMHHLLFWPPAASAVAEAISRAMADSLSETEGYAAGDRTASPA